MADLDDFFAKRDKKKSGKKNKFETTEDLAKILGKKVEERKKLEEGKSQYVSEEGQANQTAQDKEDEEWLDSVEKQPDYTGLKIQELILDSDDENEGKDPETREGVEGTTMKDGPWRKRNAAPGSEDGSNTATPAATPVDSENIEITIPATDAVPLEPVTAPEPEENNPAAPAPSTGGKYVPPSQRRAQEAAAAGGGLPPPASSGPGSRAPEPSGVSDGQVKAAYVPPGRRGVSSSSSASITSKPRKTGAAPNINDEEYFPSLGGS